jgi:hypothetical protein
MDGIIDTERAKAEIFQALLIAPLLNSGKFMI